MEATAPVTVEQAAAALGVSPSTVHRRIRSGVLQAERVKRPQGGVWLVHLPPGTTVAAGEPSPPTGTEATAPTAMAPAADALASLIQATLTPIIGPLVAELTASRQTIERQADQLLSQSHTIGRLEAELSAERQAKSALLASTASEPVGPPPTATLPHWRMWAQWGALALATAIIGTALLLVLTR